MRHSLARYSVAAAPEPASVAGLPVWVHGGVGSHVVLMCGAHGPDGQASYQAWHLLAEFLAARGLTAVRFDWPGDGDSAMLPDGIDRFSAGMDAVRMLYRAIAGTAGVTDVSIIGLRLGALLAARALEGCTITRLALLQPAASGARALRELKAEARLAAAGTDGGDGSLLVKGLAFSAQDLQALEALGAMPKAEARHVLIAASGDITVEASPEATQLDFSSYAAMMSPLTMEPPVALFDSVADWLARTPSPLLTTPFRLAPPRLAFDGGTEERLRFGTNQGLAGVLCRPAMPANTNTCVLMLNAGPNPHHGWGGMAVAHARALARRGVASLRFDLSGLGDARAEAISPRAAVYGADHRHDLDQAIDLAVQAGFHRIVVTGVCAGGHLAFHALHDDPRIAAAVCTNVLKLIWKDTDDLDTYEHTALQSADQYRARALSGDVWKRILSGEIGVEKIWRVARMIGGRVGSAMRNRLGIEARPEGDAAMLRDMVQAMSRRGARLTLAYADGDPSRDEAELHFGPACRAITGLAGVTIVSLGASDHELSAKKARDRLLEITAEHALAS